MAAGAAPHTELCKLRKIWKSHAQRAGENARQRNNKRDIFSHTTLPINLHSSVDGRGPSSLVPSTLDDGRRKAQG